MNYKKEKKTYVFVDGENIFFSVANEYNKELNFNKVVDWLYAKYGEIKIFIYAHFDDDGKGLSYKIKKHLEACPCTQVFDTRKGDKALPEQSDKDMIISSLIGENGLWKNHELYKKIIFMTGDATMLSVANFAKKELNIPVTIIGEEYTMSSLYNTADIDVVYLSSEKNNLLSKNKKSSLEEYNKDDIDSVIIKITREGRSGQAYKGWYNTYTSLVDAVSKQYPKNLVETQIKKLLNTGKLIQQDSDKQHDDGEYVQVIKVAY